jgi:hypothetical protein
VAIAAWAALQRARDGYESAVTPAPA